MFHLERSLTFLLVQELHCKPGKGIYNFLHVTVVVCLEIITEALFIIILSFPKNYLLWLPFPNPHFLLEASGQVRLSFLHHCCLK